MRPALDDLVSNVPKEFGGSNAGSGLAYQRNWTLCLLIELHRADGDYLVVCDYHDDVLVLEGGMTARQIDFYQVKSGKKKWTVHQLTKQETSKAGSPLPSVIGKLFRHRQTFQGRARRLAIVSSAGFGFEPEEGADYTEERFSFEALSANDRKAIIDRIQAELAVPNSEDIAVSLMFMVSTLHISDHENGTRGRLEEFLRQRFPERTQFPIHPIYKVLADEIERLSNFKQPCTAAEDLVTLKGFQRKQLEEFLVRSLRDADRKNPERLADDLRADLRSEGVPFTRARKITEAVSTYALDRKDSGRVDLPKLAGLAIKFVQAGWAEDRGLFDILKA